MQTLTNNNTAEFLLDGDEFFEQLHIAMRDLYNSAAAANSCLRLAYWGFDRMTTLPGCTDTAGNAHAATPIKDLINLLATKGHIVQIIMWYGPPVLMTMDSNWEARTAFNLLNEGGAHLPNYRAIDIYMELYKGKWAGYSTHQKIAIVTIAGVKQVFVGGFNVMPCYLSDDVHTLPTVAPFTTAGTTPGSRSADRSAMPSKPNGCGAGASKTAMAQHPTPPSPTPRPLVGRTFPFAC